MIHYIIQILFFQTLFLAVYDLFLKKETFFQWNRGYLIITSILAYVIPFIKVKLFSAFVQKDLAIEIPKIFYSNITYLDEVVIGSTKNTYFTSIEIIYLSGISIASLLFIFKIFQIYSKINTNKIIPNKEFSLVLMNNQPTAFSFFNYLFLGKTLYQKEHQHIIDHELIHIKQKHSLDLMFFEIQKIIFWMNPFSYLFQNRISTLHEYIADSKAIKDNPKQQFFENLLNQNFQIEKFAFINQFNKKSLIKKRIIMATKNKSKDILKLKYLLVLPVLLIMFTYTSCTNESNGIITDETVYEYKDLEIHPYLADSKMTTNNERKMELILALQKITIANSLTSGKNFSTKQISFTVDDKGNVINVDYSDIPKTHLDKVKIIINSIPKLKPGMINNQVVKTNMMIPYLVQNTQGDNRSILVDDSVPFSVITSVPTYPGCKGNNEKRKKCMSDKITKHVGQNFNVDLAQLLDLKPGKKRISVQFKIDKEGNVTDVKARAPHSELKEEAIRVVKTLPKMKPGKHDEKAVNVRYNLPIVFNVED